ncbi:EAL domain-containing protein [Sedimenticola hydrogenitrophicus]|uniref:EAL domain-containing protein n=1 Tax=Sedimenticola hydrogenitrophicus TaxID=2967975 RepID=UPI0021A3EB34|nr:EAL domain-containing protein [Sedimenticola hydrogenitrophicus]
MTLSKQLMALIAALLLLVFLGTFLISVHNTRDYLEKQLESHAQDAATSLGLSISPYLAERDLATITSMTDAIFDRGFYRSIRIEDMQGKPLVDRVLPVQLEGVPEWFIDALPLTTPEGTAALMDGWVQRGQVLVRSHPGYAYRQLWQNIAGMLRWFLVSAAIALLIGVLLLKRVLRPLKSVEGQADAICNREFPILEPLPRTPDIRRIVEAMNRMSAKVRQMLDELERLAAGFRRQAYQHPVTGLANKRFFMDLLVNQIDSTEEFSHGLLCLVQLKDFKRYNDERGYSAGDALLEAAARELEKVSKQWPRSQLAHLAGADFALLVEECADDQVVPLAEQLVAALAGLYATGKLDNPDVGHVGIGWFDGRQSASELLAEADMALRSAQRQGANGWHFSRLDATEVVRVRGAAEWREFIGEAVERDRIRLQYQPVVACGDRQLLHQEVLVRIPQDLENPDHSRLLTAGLFMPQVESLGMAVDIDKAVISRLLRQLRDSADEQTRYAVNLSLQSISTDGFVEWLSGQLAEHRDHASRLIFELPEYGVVSFIDRVTALLGLLAGYGAKLSIDHFGRSFSSLAYLRSLKVDYLKIDGSFMRSIEENSDNQFFVQALAEIAHGLEIVVIAEAVETESVWKILPSLHVDGAQGYFIGRPE